jgi:acetyltransferase-like isoleucine patch superfamily enzyme
MQPGSADGGWRAHPTAEVSERAEIGAGTMIWRNAHVREEARVGRGCVIGAGVYVGAGVHIGDNCKIQNSALLYEGVTLEDGAFVGPQVCFTNDYWPRAVNPDGTLKSAADWELGRTLVRRGGSVGARTVVTRDVPDHALAFGNPARLRGWVCACGRRLEMAREASRGWCTGCASWTDVPALGARPPTAAAEQGVLPAITGSYRPAGLLRPGDIGDSGPLAGSAPNGRRGFPAWVWQLAFGPRIGQ